MSTAPISLPGPALDVLRRVWGHEAFRPGQAEAVVAAFEGRDLLAVLPTGGGKSMIYQVPAVAERGLVLVVSPLLALMRDQVDALAQRGVPAALAHAGLNARAADALWTDAEHGKYRLVYLTPERLQTDLFQARAPRLSVHALAVDEAHCISEWGHDFRPAYRRIAEVRPLLTDASGRPAPVWAVTATATPEVRRDVVEQLALRDPAVVVRGFDRPNLIWSVHRVEDKARQVRDVFAGVPGSGLLYAGTRRATETWAQALEAEGVSAEPYHAGLDAERREAARRRWLAGDTRVVTATSAFGMGIDKPDVRAVVHVALPPTLEAYYQEAGRGGRDGQTAYAALIVGPGDERLPRALAVENRPTADEVQAVYRAAGSLGQVPLGTLPDGPVALDLDRLAEVAGVSSQVARASVERIAFEGAWTVEEARPDTVWLHVPDGPEPLRRAAASAPPALGRFVDRLLRTLPADVYGGWTSVHLAPLAAGGLRSGRVRDGLAFLARRGLLEHKADDHAVHLRWSTPRSASLPLDAAALRRTRQQAAARVDDVLAYVEAIGCRRQHLLAYFGERAPARCGRCDVCLGRHRPQTVTPADEPVLAAILAAVAAGRPREAWGVGADRPSRYVDGLADWLVHEGYLRLADPLARRFELTPKGQRRVAA